MRSIHPIAESASSEPLVGARLLHPDGRRLLAVGASGRLLRVDIDPEHLSARMTKTRALLDPDPARVTFLGASHDFNRVALLDAGSGLHVIDLAQGSELLHDPAPRSGYALTPGGRHLVEVRGDETCVVDLDDPAQSPPPFTTWHYAHEPRSTDHGDGGGQREETFHFLDQAEDVILHPLNGDVGIARLFIGCYGFVIGHLATVTPTFGRVPDHSRLFGDFVYDTVRLVRPYGHGFLLAVEGRGLGLSALDPETGDAAHFPGRRARDFIRAALPCAGARRAWVKTADGPFLWTIDGGVEALPAEAGDVLAAYPDRLLCATSGQRLAWMKLV